MQWPMPADTVLAGSNVTLTLAQESDAADLFAVLNNDSVWTHVRGRPNTAGELAASLAAANEVGRWPWVVRQSGAVVGTTSYLEVSPVDARLEIGFTLDRVDDVGDEVGTALVLAQHLAPTGAGLFIQALEVVVAAARQAQCGGQCAERQQGAQRSVRHGDSL